jgi:hypothetical protein
MTDKPRLTPVMNSTGCCGHVLHSCKGYRAFDHYDRELGTFADLGSAAAAILTAGST